MCRAATRLLVLSVVLVLWPGKNSAKEYILTVGNEQLRVVAQVKGMRILALGWYLHDTAN